MAVLMMFSPTGAVADSSPVSVLLGQTQSILSEAAEEPEVSLSQDYAADAETNTVVSDVPDSVLDLIQAQEQEQEQLRTSPVVSPSPVSLPKPVAASSTQFTTKPVNLTANPYKLLVSLAFGTKNALGISSYAEAHQYFCKQARDAEDANAQFAMGWLYAMGKGIHVNQDIAAYYFTKSAAQGNRDSQQWLAKQEGVAAAAVLPACMEKPPPPPPVVVEAAPLVVPDLGVKGADEFFSNSQYFPRGPIYALVSKHAPSYGVDIDFAMAVIAVESGFNPQAKSPKNAQGLMQLMPDTQVRFNVKDPYNPEQNIKGGLSYLRWLLNYFKGNVELVAAAYNAGEKNVLKYRGIPPFQETRDYVKKISTYYKKKFHAYQADNNQVMDKKSAN